MRRYFFLVLSLIIFNNSFGQSINNITLSLGQNFIFPKETKSNGNGSFIELHTIVKLTKRSSLIYGIGFSKNSWKTDYDIDTSFQYYPAINGCNCGFYYRSNDISILSFPFLYRFTFYQNNLLSASILAGIESTYTIKDSFEYSTYIRRQDNKLDFGPFNYSEDYADNDNRLLPNLFQRKLQLETLFKLRKHIYLTSELSLLFAEQVRILRFGLGLHFGK